MQIKVLNSMGDVRSAALKNDLILDVSEEKSVYDNISSLKMSVYDLDSGDIMEILPDVSKFDTPHVFDCAFTSDYIYFLTYDKIITDRFNIKLHRYNFIELTDEIVYSYFDDISLYPDKKNASFFILNEQYLIVQFEENYKSFKSYLYCIKTEEATEILDQNLTRNGIKSFIPISDNLSVIWTGHYEVSEENGERVRTDNSVEGISIVNVSQLISDILINKATLETNIIDQCFGATTISYMKVSGNYVIYSCVNYAEQNERIVFYNRELDKRYTCINNGDFGFSQKEHAYIINDLPYIYLKNESTHGIYSIEKSKYEAIFDTELQFCRAIKDIIILQGTVTSRILKKEKPFFKVLRFPAMTEIYTEKCRFEKAFLQEDEDMYIFVK